MCHFVALANSGWGWLKFFLSFNKWENNRTSVTGRLPRAAYRFSYNHIHILFLKRLSDFRMSDSLRVRAELRRIKKQTNKQKICTLIWQWTRCEDLALCGTVFIKNRTGSNDSMTSALCSQWPRCRCWCCRYLLPSRKKKHNSEDIIQTARSISTWKRMHNFTSLFLLLGIFTT